MNFGLSEEQLLFKDTLHRFLEEQCPSTRVRSVMEESKGHDPNLWTDLCELGVSGLTIPEKHGGAAMELLDAALAIEEIGYAATPGPMLSHMMAAVAISEGGNDEQRDTLLPGLASGETIVTVALGEEESEWDPEKFKSEVKDGRLSGCKPLVPFAETSDLIVVAAKDGGGPALWICDAEADGVEISPLKVVDLTRPVDRVTFSNTPVQKLEGNPAALRRTLDAGCILVAADAYGGAKRCLDMALEYTKQREQFGQVIGAFQAVKHQLADMATSLEPSMALYWYAAHTFDQIENESERHAALAKAHLCDVFDKIARDATELHGGIGFTWEFDLHLWFRRSIFNRSFLGESVIHRARAAKLAGW